MSGTAIGPAKKQPTGNEALRESASSAFVAEASHGPFSGRHDGGVYRQSLYVLIDLLAVFACGIMAYWLRFGSLSVIQNGHSASEIISRLLPPQPYSSFFILYAVLIVLSCMSQSMYRTPREMSAPRESLLVAKAVGFATVVLVLFIFTSGQKEVSRLIVITAGALNVVTLAGWRYAKRRYVIGRLQRGLGIRRALIVGSGKVGRDLASCFEQNLGLGYVFCGFVDVQSNGDRRVIGGVHNFREIALKTFADEVFVTSPTDRGVVKQIFVDAQELHLNVNLVPDLYDDLGRHAPMRTMVGFPMFALSGRSLPASGLAIKRMLDIVLSAIGLVLCAPILAAAAIWIRVDSLGPIFYSAPRVGKKGRQFRCHKLRTMVNGADGAKSKLRQANERNGPFFKMKCDPRVTSSGSWLRRYSIDELPQLLNVLVGEMSLVGPRPHPVDDFERYTFEDLRRLEVKPGVTGLWQTEDRLNPAFERSMALDLQYIENWNLWLDLQILCKTLPVVLKGQGQ
jgi:exopolysaccharide biosynthesis polyprenyl glycosylphosphotransferase